MNFQVTKKSLRNILVGASALTLCAAVTFSGINGLTSQGPETASADYINGGGGVFHAPGATLQWQGTGDGVDSNGVYTAKYRFSSPSQQNVNVNLPTEAHRCSGSFTSGACIDPNHVKGSVNINLNAGNNWTQEVSISIQQVNNVPCGAFQSDILNENGQPGAASIVWTGKDVSTCSPTPSPSPSPSVSPSPSPSASPSPKPSMSPSPKPSASPSPKPSINCGAGKVAKFVNSNLICVTQSQNQNQEQEQNNNQNQNVNNTATATGGNSSSTSSSSSNSSVNLTINNPSTTKEVVREVKTTTPQVVTQTKGEVKELPKTGLPLAGLALASLLPAGAGLKKFGKKDEVSANSIWNERQLNS